MLAKGPNTLNLANYTKADNQDIAYDPKEFEKIVEEDCPDLEQIFDNCIKDIQRYDQIYQKLTSNINQFSTQPPFISDICKAYQLNLNYDMDQEYQVISKHDVELANLTNNLEKNNYILKEQLKGWLFQYGKKANLTEVLIQENRVLRKFISAKNRDIIKLINAITKADNQELNELNDKLYELKEENGMLLDHLKQIKSTLKDKADEEKKMIEAYQKAERQKLQLQTSIKECQDQQQHYSKTLSLLQSSLKQQSQREKTLQQQKIRLKKLQQEYQNDQQQIQQQIKACKIDRQDLDRHLKDKFKGHQSQKERLMDQIEGLTEKIKRVKEQARIIQVEINRNQGKILEYKGREEDLDKKITEVTKSIETTQQDHKKYKQLQIQQLTNMDILNFDIQIMKSQLKDLQQQQKTNWQKHRQQLKSLDQQKRDQISRITKQLNEEQIQANQKLFKKKVKITQKKREAEELEKQVLQKKQQILALKQQLVEMKENQASYAVLKEKLRNQERK